MKSVCMLIFILPAFALYAQKWEKNYDFVDQCICGLSKVGKAGKIGYADKNGVEIIKLEYNDGLSFNEGYVAVKKGDKWLFFYSTGKAITDATFDDAMTFSNGLAAISKNGLYGYINHMGEFVIKCQFANARSFTEELAPAANTKGYWGYIDKQGNWVIKPQYDFADNFAEGLARVMKEGNMVYINRENKIQ